MQIRLLGTPAIIDDEGRSQPVRGHQAWALLARVVLAPRPLGRQALAAELFPESVDPLGAVRWGLAALRKALNASDCLVGDPVEPRFPSGTEIDLWQLEQDTFDVGQAGDLLEGMEPQCSPEFSVWLLAERARIRSIIDARIRREVMRALAIDDHARAVRLAELAVRRDIYNEGAHVLLVKGLAASGNVDAALAHVEATERLFEGELGVAPSSALRSAARRTVASPPAGVSPQAHIRSLMRSGLAALAAGATDAGIESLRHAVAEAEKASDRHLLAVTTLELGKGLVHSVRGFDDEGAVLLRRCTELASAQGYAEVAAAGFRELGYVEALAGRRPSAAEYLKAALEVARTPDELAAIHAFIGFNLVDWGKVEDGLGHYAIALDKARTAADRQREIWSLGLGARAQIAIGDIDVADRWLRDCLRLVDEQQWVAFRPWPVALLGEAAIRRQEKPAAQRSSLEEAFALSCQLRDPCWEGAVARSLALGFAAEGDLKTALGWLDDARRRCVRETDVYAALEVEIVASKVEVMRTLGHSGEAMALAREWLSLAARTHMDAHATRAVAFLAGQN
jgi:DNA-binding SARP family transcriptional activator